jgi:papain like cysteine protease AvrRpt2
MPLRIAPIPGIAPEEPNQASGDDEDSLPVPLKMQCQTEWCWAASAQMIVQYYGQTSVRQCDIATKHFGGSKQCCPRNPDCNCPCDKEDIAKILTDWSLKSDPMRGKIKFDEIQVEIKAKRPVEIVIELGSNTQHAEVIVGWRVYPLGQFVYINDPLANSAQHISFDTLSKHWLYTWMNIR